jgi:hypothetical protein
VGRDKYIQKNGKSSSRISESRTFCLKMGEGHYSSDAKKTKHCKGIKKLGTGKKKG